jgi:hypothetical protein
MNIRNIAISLSVVLTSGILIFSSCTKPAAGAQGPQGSAGPALTGSIFGFVALYDQYGVKQALNALNPSGPKNIRVTIDGTPYRALTDSTGKYTFNNLPTGVYNLTITDTIVHTAPALNYAPNCVKNINLVLGASEHDVHLGAIPMFTVTAFAVDTAIKTTADTLTYIKVRGSTSFDAQAREVLIFVSGSSSVNYLPAYYTFVTETGITAGKTSYSINILESTLISAGYPSGSMVYFEVYPTGVDYSSASEYEDPTTSKTVYNEIGMPAVVCSYLLP